MKEKINDILLDLQNSNIDVGMAANSLMALCDQKRTAHRCPVCGGNGLVPCGFYSQTCGQWSTTSTTPETCRSCNGAGVIFG